MLKPRKQVIITVTLAATLILVLILIGPSTQRSFFYPKPGVLPVTVGESMEVLLTRLQAALDKDAPHVTQSLQPGLSDEQIAALESQGGFRLSDDLRALYRWRNGIPTNSTLWFIPGHRWLPLEESVRERIAILENSRSATYRQRAAFSVFAGHRKHWVTVLDDGGGDGYFFDPNRTDKEGGAFFYHLGEAGYYVWFPSLRNFLAGTIEGFESHVFRVGTNGIHLDEDAERAQQIWNRFGKSNESELR